MVEVVLALGIMSFALMGIVGLLPVGLSQFRKAIDTTVQAQIVQDATNMIQRTPFADIDSFGTAGNPAVYYYDHEGIRSNEADHVYTATIGAVSDSALNGMLHPTWNVAGAPGKVVANVKAVRIVIKNRSFPDYSQTATTYVANAGN